MPRYITILETQLSLSSGEFDFLPIQSFRAYRDSVSLYVSRRCVPANQINRDLTFDGVIMSDGSYPVPIDQYGGTARCLRGCNYFHLRRRSLVQSFLRKDVPPLKLLEANSFPWGNFCKASRVAPLSPPSFMIPPLLSSSPGYSYLDTPSQRERN